MGRGDLPADADATVAPSVTAIAAIAAIATSAKAVHGAPGIPRLMTFAGFNQGWYIHMDGRGS